MVSDSFNLKSIIKHVHRFGFADLLQKRMLLLDSLEFVVYFAWQQIMFGRLLTLPLWLANFNLIR